MTDAREKEKYNAAIAALGYVKNNMTLGLGTGSTAKYLITALGEKIAQGWSLSGVATSNETEQLAREAGVEIIMPDETTQIDVAIDGTDEADPNLNLIKGGGGALLREKIVARAAKQFVVIADKSKRVAQLGAFPLPVEIESFGWGLTVSTLRKTLADMGYKDYSLELRTRGSAPFLTDGGNLIIDCALHRLTDPSGLDHALQALPGVIECGLFCGMADIIIYGEDDGVNTVAA